MPLHGHKDFGEFSIQKEQNVNEGSFHELLRFRFDDRDEDLKEHIQTCAKNATYLSLKI
jgi:hypothetical protein